MHSLVDVYFFFFFFTTQQYNFLLMKSKLFLFSSSYLYFPAELLTQARVGRQRELASDEHMLPGCWQMVFLVKAGFKKKDRKRIAVFLRNSALGLMARIKFQRVQRQKTQVVSPSA